MAFTLQNIYMVTPRLRVFSLSPTAYRHAVSEVRLVGDSKLAKVVNVRGNGCWSLCGSPATDVGMSHLSPYSSWDRLQGSHNPELKK